MKSINFYSKNIISYNLINKFIFKKLNNVPHLKNIILTFCLKKYDFKFIIMTLSALKILTSVKFFQITKAKTPNVTLKIRKGSPIGCKIILNKFFMKKFIFKLINQKVNKQYAKFAVKLNKKVFSFKICNLLKFKNLEKNYQFFKHLPDLTVNVVIDSNCHNLTWYVLKSLKFI